MHVLGAALHLLQALYLMHVGSSMRRVCYLANWAQYRNTPIQFTPENVATLIDPSLCSHVVLAFLDVKDGLIVTREYNDPEMLVALNELKQRGNSELKVMVAIGGWNAGTEPFTNIMASEETMRKFNRHAVKFLREHKLDGLDVDMEYPANRGSPPEDRQRFANWMTMLAEEFRHEASETGNSQLILSGAVGVGKKVVDTGYDIDRISEAFDFMNLMTYDFHGAWENTTGHNAPLRFPHAVDPERHQLTVEWGLDYWLSNGAKSQKLNLGIPAYGRTFRLCKSDETETKHHHHHHTHPGTGIPTCQPGPAGYYTSEPGVNCYYETCLKDQCDVDGKKMYETLYDPVAETPYMYSRRNNDWISTENVESVTAKTQLALQRHLGGIALWTLDFDDCLDLCGGGSQPLLRAINRAIDIADKNPERHRRQDHHRNKRLQQATSGHVNPCEHLLSTGADDDQKETN